MKPVGNTRGTRRAQLEVIAAAFLFALSVPAGKLLLADAEPLALSGILYFSAGTCSILLVALDRRKTRTERANRMLPGEWVSLGGAVLAGGVLAPLALFAGLQRLAAHVAGLLLNFETLFTIGLGVILSRERLGRRGWLGALGVVAGAVLLSWHPASHPGTVGSTDRESWRGLALLLAACACWGLDNNLTQRVSIHDARVVVAAKGLAGGSTSLLLAALFQQFGEWSALRLLGAAAVGAVSFGLSIALFVRGLRRLGVLQTGVLFAIAPGLAAVLSWVLLKESRSASGLAALACMTAGAVFLMGDRHGHVHTHDAQEHSHEHRHDEHHQHEHHRHEHPDERALGDETIGAGSHTHPHRHESLRHSHDHAHDIHHRHKH